MLNFVELKSHPYFNGIEWKAMSERKSVPPFQSYKFEVDDGIRTINLRTRFRINLNDTLDEVTLKRLHSKFKKCRKSKKI